MSSTRTLVITEVALAIALATVLNFLQIRLPVNLFGGSLNLSMLPLAVVALRRGALSGAVAGTIFGLIDLLIEPFFLMPLQVVLDYPLPYLLFGLGVGLFCGLYHKLSARVTSAATGRQLAQGSLIIVFALIIGGLLRLASHVASGVVFFAAYAADFFALNPTLLLAGPVDSGLNLWIYSLGYNLIYLVPSLIGAALCLLVIAPVLARAVPVRK
ncbi:MAG: energy-coupled thiamine transporter ThiT [Coriobacteriales bacterium]|jgi:thiamine transporter|nr:energy-coupled thiamine transporter ThiT [Coriobacteriales bacterium]